MTVKPSYGSVGSFFDPNIVYRVPQYQRSYAWETNEVDDFLNDLKRCYDGIQYNDPRNHFFGAIITVAHPISGTRVVEYELIDGQQRMASFTMLGSILVYKYESVIKILSKRGGAAKVASDLDAIQLQKDQILERFISFQVPSGGKTETKHIMQLSKVDFDFFQELVSGQKPQPKPDIDSHQRIQAAYDRIGERVDELIAPPKPDTDPDYYNMLLKRLGYFDKVLDDSFQLLNMITDSKAHALKLFQVINNRGKRVTQGDLLRTQTLEMLEQHAAQQKRVETLWDEILVDSADDTVDFLKWIYTSQTGEPPRPNTLLEDCLKLFYPDFELFEPGGKGGAQQLTTTEADNVRDKTTELRDQYFVARCLKKGKWPYQTIATSITAWEQYRLKVLLAEIAYTDCIPLLIAAAKMGQQNFSKIVQMIERFHFRYLNICKNHPSVPVALFYDEAKEIHDNPVGYAVEALRNKLQELVNKYAADEQFSAALQSLRYHGHGGPSNKPLKYFLACLEDYNQWYGNGAGGIPVVYEDRVNYLDDVTIEHVYPKSAPAADRVEGHEALKHSLGNLSLLFKKPQDEVRNEDFQAKKTEYKKTTFLMNHEIARKQNWTVQVVKNRKKRLIEMACAIFVP